MTCLRFTHFSLIAILIEAPVDGRIIENGYFAKQHLAGEYVDATKRGFSNKSFKTK